jgi:hypothetical protein
MLPLTWPRFSAFFPSDGIGGVSNARSSPHTLD